MQMIKDISISGGHPVIVLPLTTILCISALKDLFEDLKRHKSDREENNRQILTMQPDGSTFELRNWEDIRVGSIIKVLRNEPVPADIVLLTVSEEHSKSGECFVETKNLDGETNLKIKSCVKDLYDHFKSSRSHEVIHKMPASEIYPIFLVNCIQC